MTVRIEMQGKLEPVEVGMELHEALGEFNIASAKGVSFVLLKKPDGRGIGIYVPNMLTFEEVEEEIYVA